MKLPHDRADRIISRTREFTLKGRTRALKVAISPEGGSNAAGSGNGSALIVSSSVTSGGPHPPTGDSGTVNSLLGWDFNSISSKSAFLVNPAMDGVNHYYFDVTKAAKQGTLTAAITLVWNRDLPTLREVAVVPMPAANEWLAFAPDGHTLAVGLIDGGIRLFKAP